MSFVDDMGPGVTWTGEIDEGGFYVMDFDVDVYIVEQVREAAASLPRREPALRPDQSSGVK